MKKIVSTLLAAAVLLSLAVCAQAAEGFVYADPAAGVELTVPAGWDLEYEEGGSLRVRFVPGDAPSARMQYGSLADGGIGPSLAAAAELAGCGESQVRRITLGGLEYYRAAFEQEVSLGALPLPLPVTCWLHWENGYIYLYQYVGSPANPLLADFKAMISGAVYTQTAPAEAGETTGATEAAVVTEATEATEPAVVFEGTGSVTASQEALPGIPAELPEQTRYAQAAAAYESGDYPQAETLFASLPEYEDSGKYLRLIRIRNAGGNTSLGSKGYQKELGLTEADKQDIAAAAQDFAFADTARVLLCNPDVAAHYLAGHWSGGNYNTFLYFRTDVSGGMYRVGSSLAEKAWPDFGIHNGEFHVYDGGTDTLLFHLTLTDANTLEVHTESQMFTLVRK